VAGEASVWSISVADAPRSPAGGYQRHPARGFPASNQKLISTAIALDRLGPDYRLHPRCGG
jgi:D-alanyl-D-alanine carboxypeptidase/D-alanyl-D-alanine-endopeptidase (penicillin-binding protein 4)